MGVFPDTNWSLIRRSAGTPSVRRVAFEDLARQYRRAITAYFRARLGPDDAEDATQSFLSASFERAWWARADTEAGSFRSFLLMLMRRHATRLRAAPPAKHAPIEAIDALPDPGPAADALFDTRFALELTARAVRELRASYAARGRSALFDRLVALSRSPPDRGGLAAVAGELGIRPNTLAVELRRFRARLRDALRGQVRDLCADDASFAAEWAALEQVIGAGA